MNTKKKFILRVGGIAVAALVVLTFFSNTIYNLTLPTSSLNL